MGNYSEQLTAEEHRDWVKKVQIWLIRNDLTRRDLAQIVGYSYKTVVDSLNYYDRCSRFFIAAVNERMEGHEKDNHNGGNSTDSSH